MHLNRSRREDRNLEGAWKMLASWEITAADDGSLRLKARMTCLSHTDLHDLLDRLVAQEMQTDVRKITFDLAEVQSIGPQWTLVLAMLIAFARQFGASVHVDSLNAQPAAAASMYRLNHELMRLVA